MSDWSADPDGFNESVIREFRASGGVVGGELAHVHLLLLTTTDVRRGRRRTTPLAYHRRGERYVVIASNGGATTHPKWFRNLERDPNVTVEVGAEHERIHGRQELQSVGPRVDPVRAALRVEDLSVQRHLQHGDQVSRG